MGLATLLLLVLAFLVAIDRVHCRGKYHVTMSCLSGKPNPSWLIDSSKDKTMYEEIEKHLKEMKKHYKIHSILGYRGFIVTEPGKKGEVEVAYVKETKPFQKILLKSAPEALAKKNKKLFDHVKKKIDKSEEEWQSISNRRLLFESGIGGSEGDFGGNEYGLERVVGGGDGDLGVCGAHCPTNINAPTNFNGANHVTENNCYNYANNNRTDTFAQPGRLGHKEANKMECGPVILAAAHDQVRALPVVGHAAAFPNTAGDCLIALVVWPDVDYHWYRLDSATNRWSHKAGETAATIHDNSNHAIADPRTADRDDYVNFCRFFKTCQTVHIR